MGFLLAGTRTLIPSVARSKSRDDAGDSDLDSFAMTSFCVRDGSDSFSCEVDCLVTIGWVRNMKEGHHLGKP